MNDLLRKLHILAQGFFSSEDGQDIVEYGLIVALISCLAVAATNGIATAFNNAFVRISTTLT